MFKKKDEKRDSLLVKGVASCGGRRREDGIWQGLPSKAKGEKRTRVAAVEVTRPPPRDP